MSIIKLAPALKCYPWGGNNFQTKFGWNSEDVIAEGWLLSDQQGNESEVVTGPYAGDLFSAYLKLRPESVGTLAEGTTQFPISIKMVDNQEPSVVQVNPDKNRESIFYIVEAGPDSVIHFGPEKDITQDQLKQALQDGSIGKLLKEVKVKAGDVFLVEAGIAYAIGKDIQYLDVAQEAPLKEFKPEEVVEAIRLSPITQDFKIREFVQMGEAQSALIGQTSTFKETLVKLNGSLSLASSDETFEVLVFLDGNAVITRDDETLHAVPGNTFYMPAGSKPYEITGNATFVQVHLV